MTFILFNFTALIYAVNSNVIFTLYLLLLGHTFCSCCTPHPRYGTQTKDDQITSPVSWWPHIQNGGQCYHDTNYHAIKSSTGYTHHTNTTSNSNLWHVFAVLIFHELLAGLAGWQRNMYILWLTVLLEYIQFLCKVWMLTVLLEEPYFHSLRYVQLYTYYFLCNIKGSTPFLKVLCNNKTSKITCTQFPPMKLFLFLNFKQYLRYMTSTLNSWCMRSFRKVYSHIGKLYKRSSDLHLWPSQQNLTWHLFYFLSITYSIQGF